MYNLKVTIDPRSGFCFGVVYAIEMAEDILEKDGLLYCLGDIVHNDMEVERLKAKGLVIICYDQFRELKNAKVLIRAHGEPPETYRIAIDNNIELIDASCPVVLKLQNRIHHSYREGENILIYGKKDHAEVIGLQGQTQGNAIVFHDIDELDINTLPRQVTLYSQTTKNKNTFYNISRRLTEAGLEVKIHDTICRQVSNRDEELREFAREHDQIVFVAGRKSSNGKMLYQVCKEVNPDTYFVSSPEEICLEWFNPYDSVGICGATSTPQWLMDEVKKVLQRA
ncbi:MAG: 4-hydroxy-3-methylbut-2-enyl diphosphate reductase [Bacteroidia bacterium]|nr:4-hydroxy-3-methylbut-2-enyl diphosphate reductase [Bacteroidia bacterium]